MYGICEMSVNEHIKGTLCDCKSIHSKQNVILSYHNLRAILFHSRFIDDLMKLTSFLDRVLLSSFKQELH